MPEALGLNFETNASPEAVTALYVASNDPGTVGNVADSVSPATYALPAASMSTPCPSSYPRRRDRSSRPGTLRLIRFVLILVRNASCPSDPRDGLRPGPLPRSWRDGEVDRPGRAGHIRIACIVRGDIAGVHSDRFAVAAPEEGRIDDDA